MNSPLAGMRDLGRAARSFVPLMAVVCLSARTGTAQDILITDGSMEWIGPTSVLMHLSGDHGFSAGGVSDSGTPLISSCYREGDLASVSSGASFGSWTLNVTVTLDGVVQTFSEKDSSLQAGFTGSFVVPPAVEQTTLSVPVAFSGSFNAQYPALPLALTMFGTGIATVRVYSFQVDPDRAPGVWATCIRSPLRYDLGAPLPVPWLSGDVGILVTPGAASHFNDQFVLVGSGADIWGSADAFRFAYQPLPGRGSVTAHVAGANSVMPLEWRGYPPRQEPNEFAKAGVMLRGSNDPAAASVILDVKPNGELEFMARYANGEATHFLSGASAAPRDVWLRLSREGNHITATYSSDGVTWNTLGTVSVLFDSDELLAGLAVTSHQPDALYAALFDHVSVSRQSPNLLIDGDFEAYDPPALGPPGWISDHAFRQSPAKSETHQPRSGLKNGACWTPEFLDCGIYQEAIAPTTGTYIYTVYASGDRAGGVVGANVNGLLAASRDVTTAPFGDYTRYTMTFTAAASDVIRVWMYSPASPGYVVIDDANLVLTSE